MEKVYIVQAIELRPNARERILTVPSRVFGKGEIARKKAIEKAIQLENTGKFYEVVIGVFDGVKCLGAVSVYEMVAEGKELL